MTDKLFVYGTLRRDVPNGRSSLLASSATFAGYARMKGQLLDLGPFPGFIPAAEGSVRSLPSEEDHSWVHGELYTLSDPSRTLPHLDRYEGCGSDDPEPHPFERVGEEVVLDGDDRTRAWVYAYRGPCPGSEEIPSGDYVDDQREMRKTGDEEATTTTSIDPLADHPEHVSVLARWHHAEWGDLIPESSLEQRVEKLRAEMNRDGIPMAFLALRGSTPVGSASLRLFDMHGRTDLSPWLGGVFVAREHRRKGTGSRLVQVVVDKAAELGIESLYLFTLDKEAYYRGLGWEVLERTDYRGRPVVIMQIDPASTRRASRAERPGESPV